MYKIQYTKMYKINYTKMHRIKYTKMYLLNHVSAEALTPRWMIPSGTTRGLVNSIYLLCFA